METKKTTEISTQVKFTQADIPSLLEKVNNQIKELSKNDSVKPVITQQLPGFTDIHKTDSIIALLAACGSVEGKTESFNKMADKYLPTGSKKPEFKIEGVSPKEWLDYLQIKISEITHKKELDKLRSVKTTLEANLSQEMKLANDLAKIADILNEE
jgi:hypothetical protein